METLTVVPDGSIGDLARAYVAASKAPATVRAYRSDLRHFDAWCLERGRQSLPALPETVADCIAALADEGMTAATITRRLSAIS